MQPTAYCPSNWTSGKKMPKKIALFVMGAAAIASLAESAGAACLDEAAAFARKVCGELSSRGSSNLVTTSGELNAEAKGILHRFIGSASGEICGKTQIETYEGVVRDQLTQARFNELNCRSEMAKIAVAQACQKPITYKTCRHADFGQAGWARQETVPCTSGWRDGGYNPDAYCADCQASAISASNSHCDREAAAG